MLNLSSDLDQTFAALADPVRRRMLAQLSRGPASVSALASPLPISLPAVLQHLKALEASGLVASTKKGRVRTVAIAPAAWAAAANWIAERRCEWEAQLDRLEDHLQTLNLENADDRNRPSS